MRMQFAFCRIKYLLPSSILSLLLCENHKLFVALGIYYFNYKRLDIYTNYFKITSCTPAPFLEPVDWRGLELWDYPQVIKKMMDLGTVKKKLENSEYRTASECADDIRLIWQNCKEYNADGSDFYNLAVHLMKKFEDRYKKIQAEYDTGEDLVSAGYSTSEGALSSSGLSTEAPSLDAKTTFAANIFKLNGDELGYVLQTIDLRCPSALEKIDPRHDDQLEINVDMLDIKTFFELQKYVDERLSAQMSSVGKRSGTGKRKR